MGNIDKMNDCLLKGLYAHNWFNVPIINYLTDQHFLSLHNNFQAHRVEVEEIDKSLAVKMKKGYETNTITDMYIDSLEMAIDEIYMPGYPMWAVQENKDG